jgi:hypothetical protein
MSLAVELSGQIARRISRARSTVSRETARNSQQSKIELSRGPGTETRSKAPTTREWPHGPTACRPCGVLPVQSVAFPSRTRQTKPSSAQSRLQRREIEVAQRCPHAPGRGTITIRRHTSDHPPAPTGRPPHPAHASEVGAWPVARPSRTLVLLSTAHGRDRRLELVEQKRPRAVSRSRTKEIPASGRAVRHGPQLQG